MKKLRENLAKIKKSDKGFTLVELIIVVAIIAVLAAVLAPQYMQYVERSRQSNDLQVATSIMRAATAAVADPNNEVASTRDVVITWSTRTTPRLSVTGSGNDNVVCEAIAEVMGWEMSTTAGVTVTVEDAQSAAGNLANFICEIDMETGAVSVLDDTAAANSDDDDNWVDVIGVNP